MKQLADLPAFSSDFFPGKSYKLHCKIHMDTKTLAQFPGFLDELTHLQDLSKAGLPVVHVVPAVQGHVHAIDGIAVHRTPNSPISPVEVLIGMVVAHKTHHRRDHLAKGLFSAHCFPAPA